ncbi:MAG: SGNH/GDSL hydrolase family protein [Methanotrichaceae archaeon]|nr:SGNH/GDSL hydrolase family protein [Methanotrichaceae archaeon]
MTKVDSNSLFKRIIEDLRNGCDVIIVCFGDSITAGYGVSKGFPHYWKEMIEKTYPEARIEIINSGISGDTTMDGLARLDLDVLFYSPDLVTVNFGINDAAMGVDIEEFKKNQEEIVSRILEASGSEVLLLSSQPLESPYYYSIVLRYYKAIAEVAKKMNVGFLDVYEAWIKRTQQGILLSSLILPGLDHPNEEGYKIIAEELMKLFQE